ncbi:MAG: ribosome maturation factor RimM [Chitinophagaceae bacterium]|nr:ribosome maturation factor RimM [Chitinophagaceae bacterium]
MEYLKIGKFVSAFGLKGELILVHNFGKKTTLKGLQAIFVEDRKGSFLPWFVEGAKAQGNDEIVIKLEGINTREAAVPLAQKEVWLPEDVARQYIDKSAPINLLGYIVVDNNNPLGPILELIEQPHQLLCRLEIKGKEVLIPLHEESLRKVDHKKKEVAVVLPEGLLEVYLG